MSKLTVRHIIKTTGDVKSEILPDGRMDRTSAARYLGVKPQTLAKWGMQEKGPRFVRVGGRVFYFLHDLDAYIQEGLRTPEARQITAEKCEVAVPPDPGPRIS